MASFDESMTRVSLLWRVRNPADQMAWEEFVERYAPRIYGWCQQRGLQPADCEEISQEVLLKLLGAMRRFEYDPQRGSYRGWLKTVTHHAISDAVAARGQGRADGYSAFQSLSEVEARKSLAEQLAEEFDLELQAEAMRLVKSRVQENTWQVFERRTLQGESASDVAVELEMSVAAVNMANHRVKSLLRSAIAELENG